MQDIPLAFVREWLREEVDQATLRNHTAKAVQSPGGFTTAMEKSYSLAL